jgi:hypothetical protein
MNAAGQITGTYTYDVFGAVKTQTGSTTEQTVAVDEVGQRPARDGMPQPL